MSKEYDKEIEKMVQIAIQNPNLLGIILKNYDKLVKEKDNMSNLELPYWCYGWCRIEKTNDLKFKN